MIMKEVLTLSHFLCEDTPTYGNTERFQRKQLGSMCCGDSSNSQSWKFNNHTGTHVDLQSHFINNGKKLEDYKNQEWFFYNIYILKITVGLNTIIKPEEIFNEIPKETDFLIIKTGFQARRGTEEYWKNGPGISPDVGKWLKENRENVKGIGFDFISLTSYSNRELGREAHREFLSGEKRHIRIVEDMNLNELERKPDMLIVAPLLISGVDGSPVNVMAIYN